MEQDKNINKELLTNYLLGETTPDESKEAEYLIKSNEEAWKYYKQLERVFEVLEKQKIEKKIDVDEAIKKFLDKTEGKKVPVIPIKRKRNFTYYVIRIAAVFILTLGICYFFYHPTGWTQLATLKGEKTSITLADGTIVFLNTSSTISYPETFDNDLREVKFTGEAFFEVTQDKNKPFVISIGDARIKVVGTSFNVKANAEDSVVIVTVAEGKVALFENKRNIILAEDDILDSGSKGIYNKTNHSVNKTKNDDENYLYWKTEILTFKTTPLHEVITTLNDKFSTQLIVKDNRINNCPLTAEFNNKDLESILDILKLTFDIEIKKENGIYYLYGEGC